MSTLTQHRVFSGGGGVFNWPIELCGKRIKLGAPAERGVCLLTVRGLGSAFRLHL